MTALDQLFSFIGQVVLYEGSSSGATFGRFEPVASGISRPEAATERESLT